MNTKALLVIGNRAPVRTQRQDHSAALIAESQIILVMGGAAESAAPSVASFFGSNIVIGFSCVAQRRFDPIGCVVVFQDRPPHPRARSIASLRNQALHIVQANVGKPIRIVRGEFRGQIIGFDKRPACSH